MTNLVLSALFVISLIVFSGNSVHAESVLDENNAQTKNSVINLMNQFAAVINSGQKDVISEFVRFYVDRDANCIKTSKLYDAFLEDKIIGQENLDMSREEYIRYLYHISSTPITYSMAVSVTNVDYDKGGNISASISMNEISVSAIKKESTYNKDGQSKANDKISVITNCNISFRRSSTLIITGSNCIEKIRPQ